MEVGDLIFHEHPLMLTEGVDVGIICNACCEFFKGPAYTCSECQFCTHKSCGELPQEIQNPYHPHCLTLVTDQWDRREFRCAACLDNQCGFLYHCGKCEFYLDVECAFQKVIVEEGQDQLHHLTHLHPLVATCKEKKEQDNCCKICREPRSDVLYGCDPCNFYLHRSCAKFPLTPTLQHFYHPCLLTLHLEKEMSDCKACGSFYDFYSYLCKPCDFRIELSCAMLPIILESRGQPQIQHFSHGHPLKRMEIKHDDEILCSACQKSCSGQTYVCCSSKCKFFLHDVCFNLPMNISHPFHPHQLLTLYSPIQHQSRPICRVCYRFCFGFTYSCNECRFNIDVECRLTTSYITFQGHHHKILFADGLDPCQAPADGGPSRLSFLTDMCSACVTHCECSVTMFRCVECDFKLHFKCGPLPYFVRYEDHPCSLKLTESPVIVEGENIDTDVFYCDICEKTRDPHLPIYYCSAGCAYIAELKCVISEVLLSLRGEYGEVELRSIMFKHKAGKVICKEPELARQYNIATSTEDSEAGKLEAIPSLTMKEVLYALPEPEMREIKLSFSSALNNDPDHDSCLTDKMVFSCFDEDYNKFKSLMDTFDDSTNLADLWENNDQKVVNVRNHLVVSNLAPILEDLCAKYGDTILESSPQSSGARIFFINTLCETIRSMCTTRIVNISEVKLRHWWRCWTTLQYVGFKVEFALDRLKRVIDAYYALRVQQTIKSGLEEMYKEIASVSQDIDQLEANVEAQKAKLVALKERRKNTAQHPKPASSSMVVECFKEASVLKWMIVGEGLL